MNHIINLYKEPGETPRARLLRHVARHPTSSLFRLTYLGRLDPLAEGVLLAAPGTIGAHVRAQMLALPKTYRATVLVGFATDTYDILGIITQRTSTQRAPALSTLRTGVASLVGARMQPYPPYSSKPVSGKPLFQHARDGTLGTIDIPQKEVFVHTAVLCSAHAYAVPEVHTRMKNAIQRVVGDFRQDTILSVWDDALIPQYTETVTVIEIELSVSSGTYVRALVAALGRDLHQPMCLLHLVRTHVGNYTHTAALRE